VNFLVYKFYWCFFIILSGENIEKNFEVIRIIQNSLKGSIEIEVNWGFK